MENSILVAAKKGDDLAFKKIFDYYLPRMRSICLRYAHTDFEVDDILQEAFIKISESIKDFRFEGSFEGWVRKIVVNTALNHIKKNKSYYAFQNIEEINETEIDQKDIMAMDEAEPSALLKILEELPPGYKLIINLYVLEEYSHKEIAEMLEISEGTSRSQYSKAKKMIINLMSRQRIEERSSLVSKKSQNG